MLGSIWKHLEAFGSIWVHLDYDDDATGRSSKHRLLLGVHFFCESESVAFSEQCPSGRQRVARIHCAASHLHSPVRLIRIGIDSTFLNGVGGNVGRKSIGRCRKLCFEWFHFD